MSEIYAYGREEVVYVARESANAFGSLVYPAGADAINVLKADFGFKQERGDIRPKGATRSLIDRVTRRKTADWSIEKYLLPSGDIGGDVPPDDYSLWEAAFGAVDQTGMIFSLAAEPALSLTLMRKYGPHLEIIYGAVPSKWGLKFGGGDDPKVTFSGQAADQWFGGANDLDTLAEAATATDEIVVHDASLFALGMKIVVGDEDNGGDGFVITDIDLLTNTLTLDDPVTSQDEDAAVIPLALIPETAGNVIPVVIGTVKFNGDPVYITGASFDLDQKVKMRNDEYGTDKARGFRHPDFRDVSCSLDLWFEKGAAAWLNDAKRFTAQDIEVVLGNAAGSMMQIDCNQVEFTIPKPEYPDTDEGKIALAGKCLGDDGEDEISVTFM
jgi:hypothetical protein